MPFKLLDNAQMSVSGTPGTGAITLGSASSGYQSFATAGIADGDKSYFMAIDGTAWELFLGTYTASGTSLARTTRLSSSSGSAISLTSATVVTAVAPGALFGVDLQVFTSSGTWTKPAWAKTVEVLCIGGGAGGGSGARVTSLTNVSGGAGGGPGHLAQWTFQASDLTSTVSVTVGAAGTGGASITSGVANGNAGTAGGTSSFGSYLKAAGGAQGGGGQTSGTNSTVAAHAIGPSAYTSNSGAGTPSTGQSPTKITPPTYGPIGGGGGGGYNNSNATFGGGNGRDTYTTAFTDQATGGTGGTASSTGQDGEAGSTFASWFGTGGGGGGGRNLSPPGGNGGVGGNYGGGGGGGGAARDANSGAGGNGGPGVVVVISRH